MASAPPKVLISYSHDSAEHERRVLALANELCTQGGVDAWIDRYRPDPDEGWISWMRENIERADRVLLVFTETYARRFLGKEVPGKGLGVTFEGVIISQALYESGIHNAKFRPVLNFWRPTPSALLALGLRSHTDIPALKELEEWFDAQKEIRAIANLDPYFERTSRLAARRLKRELERRGTLGEFALEPDSPHLKRILPEEGDSDLFRSDGLDSTALSCHVESPQSVVQGSAAQGSAVLPL
jgi:hypothetical protein